MEGSVLHAVIHTMRHPEWVLPLQCQHIVTFHEIDGCLIHRTLPPLHRRFRDWLKNLWIPHRHRNDGRDSYHAAILLYMVRGLFGRQTTVTDGVTDGVTDTVIDGVTDDEGIDE